MGGTVVLGWGNTARGDDGLGPLLAAHVEAMALPDVTVVEDWQLQIEHALDIAGADLVLFVDAARDGPAPFGFREAGPARVATPFSHALSPEAVLAVFERVNGEKAPPSFVLGVRGDRFELGTGLGTEAEERLTAAKIFVVRLMAERTAQAWRGLAGVSSSLLVGEGGGAAAG